MHIAVTGNIGAGKTTLTTMLAKHYGWEAQFEDVDRSVLNNILTTLTDFFNLFKATS